MEVAGRQLRVNGRPILLKGVNRHEHDERRGKAVTEEGMVRDVLLLKQFNFNSVRCAHYPNHPRWCVCFLPCNVVFFTLGPGCGGLHGPPCAAAQEIQSQMPCTARTTPTPCAGARPPHMWCRVGVHKGSALRSSVIFACPQKASGKRSEHL